MDTQLFRLAFLRKTGWQARHVLDIGAHKGDWSRAFHRVFPTATPLMIEADARHEPFLQATGFPYRISLVGRTPGLVDFHTLENTAISQGASIYRENTIIYQHSVKTLQMPMLQVDEIVASADLDTVNFIKLDVQGAEIDVLEGSKRVLATHPVDFVLAELSLIPYNNGAPLADRVIAYMRSIGFGMHDIFELHYWNEQLFQIDVLFARDRFLTSPLLASRGIN